MIESVDVVLQCNPGGFEMRNRSDDIARSHLTCGIVIEADAQYPGVRSTHRPCVRSPCKMHTRRHNDHMQARQCGLLS